MMGKPVVVVCADDFGMTTDISETISQLIEDGAVNATTCLVGHPGWSNGIERLRRLAEQRRGIGIGLHLELASPWISRTAARESFRAQWRKFEDGLGRSPDFLDGHRHVHLFLAPMRALFEMLEYEPKRPWLRQSKLSSRRFTPKRLVLDPLSVRLREMAKRRGYVTNPGFGGVRQFSPKEDIAKLWHRDLKAMTHGGVLMTHPGPTACGDGLGICRAQEAVLLANGTIAKAIAEAGLTMAQSASPWDS